MSLARLRTRQALGDLAHMLGRRRLPAGSLSVLMYHAVTREVVRDSGQESIPAALFEEQRSLLRSLPVEVLPLEEAIARVAAPGWNGHAVAVVFDDGYAGIREHALEILVRHRIRPTVFVVTASIGASAFPWAPPGLGRPLDWSGVAALAEAGCAIGSHSHRHQVLATLEARAIREELLRSRHEIEQRLGIRVGTFAYPYGSYGTFDARTRAGLLDAGFTIACTTVWGRYRAGDDPLAVKRIRVAWCDSPREVLKSMAGCYDWYRLVQRLQARTDARSAQTARSEGGA
jgi:peptidoglycan/xylan/chitin deacetylase (PgdA/CDA1 family)